MIKQIIALAAGALLSTAASAGYVQYVLSGPGSTGAPFQSTIVIRDEDKSVAFYGIYTIAPATFISQEASGWRTSRLIETTTSFTGLGPTNMYLNDIISEDSSNFMWLMFSEGDKAGTFNYNMRVITTPPPFSPAPPGYVFPRRDITFTGTASQVALSPDLIDAIERGQFRTPRDIPYYDPTQVPEPASAALFGIGALGVAALRRRRKQ